MTARVWSFADWWTCKVRAALRTRTGDDLRTELAHLVDLAADRDVNVPALKPLVTRADH